MLIRKCYDKLSIELPEDGFYFVNNDRCYKLTGELIEEIYYSFSKSKSCFKTLMQNYKKFADKFECTHTSVKHLLNCFYKLYKTGYYENIDNFKWLLSVIDNSNDVFIEELCINVFIKTGFIDSFGKEVFENDVLIGDNTRYTVVRDKKGDAYLVTSDGDMIPAHAHLIKFMIKE